MPAPRFVAQKVGDQYVLVPQQPAAGNRPKTELWLLGGVFTLFALLQRGWLRIGFLSLAGVTVGMAASCLGQACGDRAGKAKVRSFTRGPSFPHEGSPLRPVQPPTDAVEESSMESFPASDPPARMTPSQAD